jgi:hypothetical protein
VLPRFWSPSRWRKEDSTLLGFMDGLALSISIGLQYGVPLKALVDRLTNTRFEPSGFTDSLNCRRRNLLAAHLQSPRLLCHGTAASFSSERKTDS